MAQSLIDLTATDRMLVTMEITGIEFWFNHLEDLVANEEITQATADDW